MYETQSIVDMNIFIIKKNIKMSVSTLLKSWGLLELQKYTKLIVVLVRKSSRVLDSSEYQSPQFYLSGGKLDP